MRKKKKISIIEKDSVEYKELMQIKKKLLEAKKMILDAMKQNDGYKKDCIIRNQGV